MENRVFPPRAFSVLEAAYPDRAVKLEHNLTGHPLLSLEQLVRLATQLPKGSVEYNQGNLPIGINPEDVPTPQLSIEDTIRSIEESGSWMVLKRIEQHPDYAKLLTETLAELEPFVTQRTGAMVGHEGFIFISSPGAVTPFHFDPEHNILMQMRGSKTMTVFTAGDEMTAPAELHERFHLGEHHRNLPWRDEFAGKGQAFDLIPGEAIHVPVKAPHWVKNGPEVSISLSITWRSEWSYAEADSRAFNHLMRKFGMRPRNPAAFPSRNLGKSLAYRAIRRCL
jgi:mannose-6-phosphate isomerase-like protein (cupin superfamily)